MFSCYTFYGPVNIVQVSNKENENILNICFLDRWWGLAVPNTKTSPSSKTSALRPMESVSLIQHGMPWLTSPHSVIVIQNASMLYYSHRRLGPHWLAVWLCGLARGSVGLPRCSYTGQWGGELLLTLVPLITYLEIRTVLWNQFTKKMPPEYNA